MIWLALHPAEALAHAYADKSDPQPGAVLATPPQRVDIWFTEHLTPGVSTIQVFNGERQRVDQGDTKVDPGNTLHMGVDLQPLPPGVYTVVWSNVSADDGHPNKGGFAFTVAVPTPTAAPDVVAAAGAAGPSATATPAPTPLPLPSQSEQAVADLLNPATDRPTAAVDLVAGWLAFTALVLSAGGAMFALVCLLPALGSVGVDGSALAGRLCRRFYTLVLICAALGAGGAFLSLLAKAEIATGLPPGDLVSGAVLGALLAPWSGRVWTVREAAFALLAVIALIGVLMPRRAGGHVLAQLDAPAHAALALVAAVGLVSQALDSHLAAGHVARQGPLGTLDLSVHLLAVGVWVGGLAYAALLLWPVWRRLAEMQRAAVAARAIARFSPLALASVGLIVLTGTYAAILLLPSFGDLLTSAYGQALDVKVALLLVLILFGAANRRTLAHLANATTGAATPAMAHAAAPTAPAGGSASAAPASVFALAAEAGRPLLQAMRREFAIAGVVLLAAGTMLEVGPPGVALAAAAVKLDVSVALAALPATATPVPPTPTATPAAAPRSFAAATKAGDLALSLAANPAVAGATSQFTVQVEGSDGKPVNNAEVKLRLTAQSIDVGTRVLTTQHNGDGQYTLNAPAFAVSGIWQVLMTVRRDNFPEVDSNFSIPVAAPSSPVPTAPPAAPSPVPTPSAEMLHATLAIQPDPPTVGVAQAVMHLTNSSGQPLSAAQIQVLWLMPEHAHLSQTTLQPRPGSLGSYGSTVDLSMAGAWLADATVTLSDGRTVQLQFAFNVRDRGLLGSLGGPGTGQAAVQVPARASGGSAFAAVSASPTALPAESVATATIAGVAAERRAPSDVNAQPGAMSASSPTSDAPLPVPTANGPLIAQRRTFGDLDIVLQLQPAIFRPASVAIRLLNRAGQPATDVQQVDVQFAMQGMSHGAHGVTATRVADGTYRAQGMLIVMEGPWWMALRIRRSDGRLTSALFSIQVPADQPSGPVSAFDTRPAGPAQIVDVAIYPSDVDPAQVTVRAGRRVDLQALYVDHPACGSQVRLDELGLRAPVDADGVGDLSFVPPRGGALHLSCSADGLALRLGS